jgi:hypothetical protein
METEPNDRPSEAQSVNLPCEYVGQFYPRSDRDWLTFEAKKGAVYSLEIFSQRIGSAADPFVLVQRVTKNKQGEESIVDVQELYDSDMNIGGNEFKTSTRDPSWRFEVKETGIYRVQVRNLFRGSHDDPAAIYRLAIRNELPDFRLVAMPQSPPPANKDSKELMPWSLVVRKGGVVPIKVLAFRQGNFAGEIVLTVEGLPQGVTCPEAIVADGANTAALLVQAGEDVSDWSGPIRVLGRAKIRDTDTVREASAATLTWPVKDYGTQPVISRLTKTLMVGGCGSEADPLFVRPAEDRVWESCPGGKLDIPLRLTRRADFNGPVKLKAAGLAPLDSLKELEIDNQATNGVLQIDVSQQKLTPGSYSFYLLAQSQVKYRRLRPEQLSTAEEHAKRAEEALKEAEDLASKQKEISKKASEALAAASKRAVEAAEALKAADAQLRGDFHAKLQTAKEAEASAQTAANEAKLAAKEAEAKRDQAANKAKEAAAKLKFQDLHVTSYSTPIRLKIAAAPIELSVASPTAPIPVGKAGIQVTIRRLFGFAGPVDVELVVPKGTKGISAAKATIPTGQLQAVLVLDSSPEAIPGNCELIARASAKFNGQEVKADQNFAVKFAEKRTAKAE